LAAYADFGSIYRHCRRPVAPIGGSVRALYQKLYIQSKSAPEDGRICRPKHAGLN
jgi:hypothetical protein